MKPFIPYSLLAAAALCGVAFGQSATTTPVGYITINIAGSGTADSADTYISPTLIQPTEFAGISNVSPSGGDLISFASTSVPTGLDQTYVLEITSGAFEGWWSTVLSSTASSIQVNDSFPSGLPAGVTVSVRKHNTLGSFLGANAPGLITFDGVNDNDEVQVLDPVDQVVKTFAYVSAEDLGAPEGAWFDLTQSEVANDFVIEPGSAVKVKRVGDANLSFVMSGEVKTTKTQVDLFTSFNWVGTLLATGQTLDGMTLNSQLIQFDGVSANYDELQILRSTQIVEPFAAIDDGSGGATMFNLATSEVAGDEPFPEGTGVVILRTGNPASTITIPGTVVAP